MGEGNGFPREEKTVRTQRMDGLEERAARAESKLKLVITLGSVIGLVGTLIGGGWTLKTYTGHVATAAEVEKMKVAAAKDREDMAAIKQAHNDDREWRDEMRQDITEVKQQMKQLLDLALGRTRRSDGR